MTKLITSALLCTAMSAAATAGQAIHPDDVVVMRRAVAPPVRATSTPAPPTTPAPTSAAWVAGEWTFAEAAACTDAARQTRTVVCKTPEGEVAPSRCLGARPEAERLVARTNGCTFSWRAGTYGAYDSTCSDAARRDVISPVACVRSDGAVADDAACVAGERPLDELTKPVHSGCTLDWAVGGYGDWSSACSADATRSRSVACQRSGGTSRTVEQPDAMCAGSKPASAETAAIYAGCAGTWTTGAWTDAGACQRGRKKQTADPVCILGSKVDDSQASCDPTRRPATQTTEVDCAIPCQDLARGKVDVPSLTPSQLYAVSFQNGRVAKAATLADMLAAARTACDTVPFPEGYRYKLTCSLDTGSRSQTVVFAKTASTTIAIKTGSSSEHASRCGS